MENCDRYAALHPAFAAAFDFLRKATAATLEAPRHELDGKQLYVVVDRKDGRTRDGAKLEVHRRYIDIQYVVEGTDEMGWKALGECGQLSKEYDDAKDVLFYADRPEAWVRTPPGAFAIFFPEDAHAPLGGTGPMVKLIAKVAV
ncbi:MAG: YhcH/YjgK/YiaL family protein [Planctomycetes bacterium]|nr:YhcH/YjgK/YiaL family protein [Planctomycetota bacterium]